MSLKSVVLLILIPVMLCACTGSAHLDGVRSDYAVGQHKKLIPKTDKNTSSLDLLIGAQAAFQDGQYARSDELFEVFNKRAIDPTRTSAGREIGTLAGGAMAVAYKPYMMDYLFVSYYQLWDALLLGNTAQARVIINQSYSRQQKMSSAYRKLIQSRQKTPVPGALAANTKQWDAYSDIMNPALTYLAGIYFLNQGEYENARQYLSRASGMMPKNTDIKTDLSMAEQGIMPKNTAWVFIESGFAPRLREHQINIPWPVGDNIQVISISTARPDVNKRNASCQGPAQLLADTDAMFFAEFNEYQINDAIRSLTKAASNVAVQSATSDALNGWGSVLGAIYAVATTDAEVRSWATLPQRTCVMRIHKDKTGLIKLPGGDTIPTKYSDNDLIYIRGSDVKQVNLN